MNSVKIILRLENDGIVVFVRILIYARIVKIMNMNSFPLRLSWLLVLLHRTIQYVFSNLSSSLNIIIDIIIEHHHHWTSSLTIIIIEHHYSFLFIVWSKNTKTNPTRISISLLLLWNFSLWNCLLSSYTSCDQTLYDLSKWNVWSLQWSEGDCWEACQKLYRSSLQSSS